MPSTLVRPVLVALLLLVLLAPAAPAQLGVLRPEVDVHFQLPPEPLDPFASLAEGETALEFPFRVTYTVPAAAYSPQPTVVEVQVVDIPVWLAASVTPNRFEVPVNEPPRATGVARAYVLTGVIALATATDAPALTDGVLEVRAVARTNGPIDDASDRHKGIVRVSYASRLDAVAEPFAVAPGEGDTVVVPILVRNLGNGPAVVNATVRGAPAGVATNLSARETLLEHAGAPARRDVTTFTLAITREARADTGEVVVEVTSRLATGIVPSDSRLVRVYVGEEDRDALAWGGGGTAVVPALAFLAAAAVVAGLLVRR